jgi:hypothetical protein
MYSRTIATFAVSFLLAANAFCFRDARTYEDTRKLLTSLKNVKDDRDVLAALFKNGDARVGDLIEALHDPDRNISVRSQIVIRYLGNPAGMKALNDWYTQQSERVRSGPIPIPLGERDYKWITDQGINDADDYIYALALDGSPRARSLLDEMMKRAGSAHDGTFASLALGRIKAGHPEKLLFGGNHLAKLVLRNAFFVGPLSRQYASARLLGLNGAKDKALVEVYVNRGPLAEEWYHVVIRKHGKGWKFFSITQVAVS